MIHRGRRAGHVDDGFPRNLGGLVLSCRGEAARASPEQKARVGSMGRVLAERTAATDRYGAVKETKPSRMEGEKSESADNTDEGGEPTRRDPLEESGRSD